MESNYYLKSGGGNSGSIGNLNLNNIAKSELVSHWQLQNKTLQSDLKVKFDEK